MVLSVSPLNSIPKPPNIEISSVFNVLRATLQNCGWTVRSTVWLECYQLRWSRLTFLKISFFSEIGVVSLHSSYSFHVNENKNNVFH